MKSLYFRRSRQCSVRPMGVAFSAHTGLLEQFLARRQEIVDEIERRLLSPRGKAFGDTTERGLFDDILNRCFFESPAVSLQASHLKGQLAAAHIADGFEPVRTDGYSRELDPVELVLRGRYKWDGDRWPGRNGRIAYAQSLYAVFMLRQLEHLGLRIWDDGNDTAPQRLQDVQRLLNLLNTAGAAPRVRDARWLIQTAQGPLTRHLKPYFMIADRISASFTDSDRIEIHRAGAMLAGGHLRSQLRHRARETGRTFDHPEVLALMRLSSAMDIALLVRDLVPLLHAYSTACSDHDADKRQELADAILQGLSADPELLLTRLDLLAPSTMIEDLFIDRGEDGQVRYTPMGEAHRGCLARYAELIGRTAESLKEDARLIDPAQAAYSPLGIVYGFSADILSNMVLNTLCSPSSSSGADLSLEDTFISRGRLEEKRAQAQEWQCLPKSEGERDAFEHSTEWAEQMFGRMLRALEARAARPTGPNASSCPQARLYVVPRGVATDSLPEGVLPGGIVSAQEHCLTLDLTRARETGATALPKSRLSTDRAEGRFLASIDSDGAWFCVSKVPLTLFTSQGKDAVITDVPSAVIDVLRLVCPEYLVVVSVVNEPPEASHRVSL
jgi:hypothetical protein